MVIFGDEMRLMLAGYVSGEALAVLVSLDWRLSGAVFGVVGSWCRIGDKGPVYLFDGTVQYIVYAHEILVLTGM